MKARAAQRCHSGPGEGRSSMRSRHAVGGSARSTRAATRPSPVPRHTPSNPPSSLSTRRTGEPSLASSRAPCCRRSASTSSGATRPMPPPPTHHCCAAASTSTRKLSEPLARMYCRSESRLSCAGSTPSSISMVSAPRRTASRVQQRSRSQASTEVASSAASRRAAAPLPSRSRTSEAGIRRASLSSLPTITNCTSSSASIDTRGMLVPRLSDLRICCPSSSKSAPRPYCRTSGRPRVRRSSSRRVWDGPTHWPPTSTVTPGAAEDRASFVRPPQRSCASSRQTRLPASRSRLAAVTPPMPPPTMTASYSSLGRAAIMFRDGAIATLANRPREGGG